MAPPDPEILPGAYKQGAGHFNTGAKIKATFAKRTAAIAFLRSFARGNFSPGNESDHGGRKTERLLVVDWEHPANNDFLLVSQFSVTGALYTCRPDLVGLANGLPLVVIELKKPGVPARAAFDENLTHYKQEIRGCSSSTRCSEFH